MTEWKVILSKGTGTDFSCTVKMRLGGQAGCILECTIHLDKRACSALPAFNP